MADKENDLKKWLELRGLAPRGYQVFYVSEQSVGNTKFRETRGYVEHLEECGGVTLNPTGADWHPSNWSFGEF